MKKPSLTAGSSATQRYDVDEARTMSYLGADNRVYSTPSLLRDIEVTARQFLLAHLDEGEDSVGTEVALSHLSATPFGFWVEITVTVTEIDRRRVTFDFSVRDQFDEVSKGSHSRFIIDKAKSAARIADKIARAKE